jgi:esterase
MKLFFRKYGSGPPLLILHGLYGSSDNWISIARNIERNFTVYLPDQRNHGQSPHSDYHDYESLCQDLYELAEDLDLDKFFLAGHSMGGKVAIKFALKWPEKISGLVIVDISPFPASDPDKSFYSQHKKILDTILSIDVAHLSSRTEADALLSIKIDSEKVRGFILKNLQRMNNNSFKWKLDAESLRKNLVNIMDGIQRPDEDTFPVTGFPVLFLKGENSNYIPESDFSDIGRIFPAAEIIKIKDAGHWIHSDRPDAIERNLLSLLNS